MQPYYKRTIAVSTFFMKSRKPSGYFESYNEEELLKMVDDNFILATKGYREGVALVPIEPRKMKCAVVTMTPDMEFETTYESRIPGETPRKKTVAIVDELPAAQYVTAVVYHKDVLAEDGDRSSNAEWEIITLLAHSSNLPDPMTPGTLMANHFKADGGTATNMTPEKFEKALRESYNFWKNHCIAQKRVGLGELI